MKKIIIGFSFLVIAFVAKAQPAQYDTCNYLQQYAGEWRYVNGQDTIRVYLRPYRTTNVVPNTFTYISDNLWGWHEYKKGNVVVESDYQHRFMTLSPDFESMCDSASIILKQRHSECSPIALDLIGTITDYNQSKEIKQVTIIMNGAGNTMLWSQHHSDGYGVFTGAYGMTLPKEFLLVKQ